jgi:rhodanese-related sulfurtransferase
MSHAMRLLGLTSVAVLALAVCGRSGGVHSISGDDLARRIAAGSSPLVLDVRTPEEYAAGHIPGARNIPYDQLAARLSELGVGHSDEIVVHCEGGKRAANAERTLADAGYTNVRDLQGHMRGWQQAGRPIESSH